MGVLEPVQEDDLEIWPPKHQAVDDTRLLHPPRIQESQTEPQNDAWSKCGHDARGRARRRTGRAVAGCGHSAPKRPIARALRALDVHVFWLYASGCLRRCAQRVRIRSAHRRGTLLRPVDSRSPPLSYNSRAPLARTL